MWEPFVVFWGKSYCHCRLGWGRRPVTRWSLLAHLINIKVDCFDHNWRIKSVFYWYGHPNLHQAGVRINRDKFVQGGLLVSGGEIADYELSIFLIPKLKGRGKHRKKIDFVFE